MVFSWTSPIMAAISFKKSCGDTIKFAAKNIPFALIQVSFITQELKNFV
jgi:hypothetical protein